MLRNIRRRVFSGARYRILFFGSALDFHTIGTYLLYVSLFMSVWSFGEYLRFFVRAVEEKEKRA